MRKIVLLFILCIILSGCDGKFDNNIGKNLIEEVCEVSLSDTMIDKDLKKVISEINFREARYVFLCQNYNTDSERMFLVYKNNYKQSNPQISYLNSSENREVITMCISMKKKSKTEKYNVKLFEIKNAKDFDVITIQVDGKAVGMNCVYF